jgi:hypothetical protein
MTRPEQSKPDGEAPPQRYGTPRYCSAIETTLEWLGAGAGATAAGGGDGLELELEPELEEPRPFQLAGPISRIHRLARGERAPFRPASVYGWGA